MYVLLIENTNLDQTESLFSSLQNQGHQVFIVDTAEAAVKKTGTLWPNLIIFNSGNSQLDLVNIQQAINETGLDIPSIVVVSNKDHIEPEIRNQTILVTPNKPRQLSQSIKQATAKQKDRFLRLPNLIIDYQQRKVLHNQKHYSLTPKEFKLLHLLVENRNQVLSRKIIMQEVWETDYLGDTRTLDVHVRWLREKIEENPSRPRRLITVRGVGYRFIVDTESE
jgi:DNA-binding response OmpR family regulator